MHDALGIQSAVRCSASNQGLGVTGVEACAGSGKGEAAGAAAEGLDGFGFFGFNILHTVLISLMFCDFGVKTTG